MEAWLKTLLAAIGGGSVIIGVVAWLAKSAIEQMLKIQSEFSAFRLGIRKHEHQIQFEWVYRKRVELIEKAHSLVMELKNQLTNKRDSLFPVDGVEFIDSTLDEIHQSHAQLGELIKYSPLYFSKKLLNELRSTANIFSVALESLGIEEIRRKKMTNEELNERELSFLYIVKMKRYAGREIDYDQMGTAIFDEAHGNINMAIDQAESSIEDLEAEFKKLIGIME